MKSFKFEENENKLDFAANKKNYLSGNRQNNSWEMGEIKSNARQHSICIRERALIVGGIWLILTL